MKSNRCALAFALTCIAAAHGSADVARVTSAGNSIELVGSQEGPIGGGSARRYMMVFDPRALQGIPPGSTLTGIRFRLDSFNGAAWPPANISFADYELRISAAATSAATMSINYANNISGPQTLVRNGALVISAGAFAAGATPRPFGPLISFNSQSFVYNGGSLCLDFNHTGTGSIVTGFMDGSAATASEFVNGLYATNRSAATGDLTSYPIIEFEYTPPSSTITPPALASAVGAGSQEGQIGGTTLRRFLFNIDEATLNIPPGSVITGLAFRLDNLAGSPWPPANSSHSDYELRIGPGVATAAMSTTYANNFTSQTLVHDGPLDLNTRVFSSDAGGAAPEQFGIYVPFSTPYPYFGGNLSIDINYPNTGFAAFGSMDATNFGDFATSGMRGLYSNSSRTAPTGALTTAPVTRVFYTAGPAPDLAKGVTKVFLTHDFAGALTNAGSSSLFGGNPRSIMIVSDASQFDTIGLGSQFVGHSVRAFTTASSWPAAVSNFASYEVNLSRSANPPSAISDTFAANLGSDNLVVRSGPLSIPANSLLPLGSGPTAPYSVSIPYTAPYTYLGGPLSFFVRHSAGSQAAEFLDAISSGNASYGTQIAARLAGNDVAPTGSITFATLIRLDVDAATNVPRAVTAPVGVTLSGLLKELDYTIQYVIAAEELRDIPVGSLIDHLWMRNGSSAPSSPSVGTSTPDFEVALSSAANRPEFASTTFALNEGADRLLVHDGLLAVPAGTFPAGATGRAGKLLRFQRAFTYQGGDLCLTIRSRAFTDSTASIEAVVVDSTRGNAIFSDSFSSPTGAVLGGSTPRVPSFRLGYTPSVTTPNALAVVEGINGSAPFSSSATIQMIIPASQLLAVDVGSVITGISFRNSASGAVPSFPTSQYTFPRFDIRVASTSVDPLSMSNTFANNVGAGEVVVREGPLTVPANAFPAGGVPTVPNEFAWFIPFDRAFIYPGGNICLTFRTQGSPPGSSFLDIDSTSPSARGGHLLTLGNPDAAVADDRSGAFVVRLAFTARAFCPSDLNNDGIVSDDDFVLFLAAYNTLDCADASMPEGCPADFNFDRSVDDLDFQLFLPPYNELLCP